MNNDLKNKLCDAINKAIDRHDIMGANFLAVQGDKELVYCQEGLADREANKPIERNSIFRLYSMTKPVTATAAMILLERGEIELYQPIADILPAFSKQIVAQNGKHFIPERPMMIHDLLNMTSGLSYPDEMTEGGRAAAKVFDEAIARLDDEAPMTTLEMANRLAECPLCFAPGTSWQYGTSADVLGAVIEVVSGKQFGQFLQDEIFAPLGMSDTGFWVPEAKQDRLVTSYETITRDDHKEMIRYEGNNLAIRNDMKKAPAYEAGGAGLASTLDDYMKFARMLRNHGTYNDTQILQSKTVDFFTHGQLLTHQNIAFGDWIGLDGYTYSNLLRHCVVPGQHRNLCALDEYGWDGWLGMYFANFPNEDLTILMGTQKRDSGTFDLTRKLRNICLSHVL